MALVPVAFAGDPMVQVLSMGTILLLFVGLQVKLWPWRTDFANYSERYFYGTVYIVRGTLVALVPVVFAGNAMVQVLAMGSVLVLFAGLQSRLWPWRTEFANWSARGCATSTTRRLSAARSG